MLRCLLVDDEPLALRLLASFVARVPDLVLVGSCRSALEAHELLRREPVDLIFLDIQMPDLTGIEFVRSLRPEALVVFTTAYDTFAVEGFALNALDYLLKPISFERFLQAVQRARERLATRPDQAPPATPPTDDYLFVKADYHAQRISLRDIRYLEGLKDYVKIHTAAPRPLLTLNSLKAFEERLPPAEFVRVHRSFIVALRHIDSIRKNRIYLGDTVIPVGEVYIEAFNRVLEQRHMG